MQNFYIHYVNIKTEEFSIHFIVYLQEITPVVNFCLQCDILTSLVTSKPTVKEADLRKFEEFTDTYL